MKETSLGSRLDAVESAIVRLAASLARSRQQIRQIAKHLEKSEVRCDLRAAETKRLRERVERRDSE